MNGKTIIGGFVLCCAACCKTDESPYAYVSSQDHQFMIATACSNFMTAAAGQLALRNGSAAVRAYGSMMMTYSTTAQQDLQQLAVQLELTFPEEPSDAIKAAGAYLSPLTGYAFDTAYLSTQIAARARIIRLMEAELSQGRNQGLKEHATRYLPAVRRQLHLADSLKNSL